VQGAVNEIHHRLLVFINEFGKGGAVATLDAKHQGGIGIGWHGHFEKI
jgi:hypothetical protein